jgi:hypothetical protein
MERPADAHPAASPLLKSKLGLPPGHVVSRDREWDEAIKTLARKTKMPAAKVLTTEGILP